MNSNLFTKEDLVKQPRATVLITHGLGEHSHRYDDWVIELNGKEISVFRYDLPGHGRTRQQSWLFNDFDQLADAIQSQYNHAHEYSVGKGIPLFLFGHSLGGLITADFAMRSNPQVEGVILSAPALDAGEAVKPWMMRMAGWLRKLVPGLPILQIPQEQLANDPKVVSEYKNDPLVYHGKIRVNTGYAMLSRMSEAKKRVKEFTHPVLMVHGEADQIVRAEETRKFFDQLSVEDKTWHSYAGMYHEILNDIGNEKVKADISQWLDKRIR